MTIPDIANHPWWKAGGEFKDAGLNMERLPEVEGINVNVETEGAVQQMEIIEPEPHPMPPTGDIGLPGNVPLHRRRSEFTQPAQQQQQYGQQPIPMSNVQGQQYMPPQHQQPMMQQRMQVQPNNTVHTNAFQMIENVTGGAFGTIVGKLDETYQIFTKIKPQTLFQMIGGTLQSMQGFRTSSLNPAGTSLETSFDYGRGICKIEISSKICADNGSLFVIELNRLGGDYETFKQFWIGFQPFVEFLFKMGSQ